MKRLAIACALLLWLAPVYPALARSAAEIRKEMAAIRRSTTWSDPAAAKAANEKIAQLAAELARSGSGAPPGGPAAGGGAAAGGAAAAGGGGAAADTEDPLAGGLDPVEFRSMLGAQMAVAVGGGKQGDILLARQVRDKIVAEYQADVDPQIKCPATFEVQTTLVIDVSSPAADAVIAQMENFRGITTLVITGKPAGGAVDLATLLRKASGYPLVNLYIVGLGPRVTALPPAVGGFGGLRQLAVFGDALTALPPEAASLRKLETLLVDANPIGTVLPAVRSLSKLTQLGLGGTKVSAAEQAEIKRLRPGCTILTQ